MTFRAKAPASAGIKTWSTAAWQGTNFLTYSFGFATGATTPRSR